MLKYSMLNKYEAKFIYIYCSSKLLGIQGCLKTFVEIIFIWSSAHVKLFGGV